MSDQATIADLILRILCKLYPGLIKGVTEERNKKKHNNPYELLYPKEIVDIKAALSVSYQMCCFAFCMLANVYIDI